MSEQYIKLLASQAGPFSTAQNVVDVDLPPGVYDLSDSFIQVTARVTTTDAGAGTGTGVYSPELVFATSNLHFPNASLVKNCSFSTDGKGQVESIRRCDVLAQMKAAVSRSQRQDASTAYLSANSVADPKSNDHFSPFLDMRKTGNTLSSLHTVPLPIRLGDLMDSCNTPYYDSRRVGTSRFRFELHAPEIIVARQTIPASTAGYSWRNLINIPAAVGAQQTNVFQTQEQTASIRTIPSTAQVPLYVGQKIQISGTIGGGPVVGVSVITQLDWDPILGQYTITIANVATLDRADTQTMTDITISSIIQPAALAVTFDRVELVARRVAEPGSAREMSLPFRTYATIEDQGVAGATQFQRQYSVAPECDGVLIAFPGVSTPWSINADIADYRLRLNQQDLTDRNVSIRSPLYYDQLSATFEALDMGARNLRLNSGDCSAATYALSYPAAANQVVVGAPLPQTMTNKYLQVNLALSGNDVQQIVLFCAAPRRLVL
jgi:hypothetical protein